MLTTTCPRTAAAIARAAIMYRRSLRYGRIHNRAQRRRIMGFMAVEEARIAAAYRNCRPTAPRTTLANIFKAAGARFAPHAHA
ncbi:hypothetical protein [Hymenobacter terricola]|uniref:hypothetical protein n=1 Tax=Hymenobacter terricola TaxID=2819236 RepID=UPI001B3128CC|nr:hypothetical protein [Hymenobacter terricola]